LPYLFSPFSKLWAGPGETRYLPHSFHSIQHDLPPFTRPTGQTLFNANNYPFNTPHFIVVSTPGVATFSLVRLPSHLAVAVREPLLRLNNPLRSVISFSTMPPSFNFALFLILVISLVSALQPATRQDLEAYRPRIKHASFKRETLEKRSKPSSCRKIKTAVVSKPATHPKETSSGSSSSSSTGTSSSFEEQVLNTHNQARAEHGANPLAWDNDLASSALAWAQRCKFQHGGEGDAGQNIAAGYDSVAAIVNAFMAEEKDYQEGVPSHFTQVVWKATKFIGAACVPCNGILESGLTQDFCVFNYGPAGNVAGEYAQNVQL